MFDETYVHWVKNETDVTRVILFCDIERPLSSPLMTRINRQVSAFLGRATAPQNPDDERVGGINQAYAWSKRFSNKISGHVKQFKRANPKAYRVLRPVLAVWWPICCTAGCSDFARLTASSRAGSGLLSPRNPTLYSSAFTSSKTLFMPATPSTHALPSRQSRAWSCVAASSRS